MKELVSLLLVGGLEGVQVSSASQFEFVDLFRVLNEEACRSWIEGRENIREPVERESQRC